MVETTVKLADFVEETSFDNLPDYLVDRVKLLLLDAIGCGICGHSTECGRISTQLAQRLGGAAESTIIGTNDKVATNNAAFANGQLIGALTILKEDHWCFTPLIADGLVDPPENPEVQQFIIFPRLERGKYIGVISVPLKTATFGPDLNVEW